MCDETSAATANPSTERLAVVLREWMRADGLTIRHLERHGGLRRNTITGVLNATTPNPQPRTLQRLARAVATDRRTGVLDTEAEERAHDEMAMALGLVPPSVARSPSLIGYGLYFRLGSRPRARLWIRAIENDAAITDEQLRALARPSP